MLDNIVVGKVVVSASGLVAPFRPAPYGVVDVVGRVGGAFDHFVVTGFERKALIAILWRTGVGVRSDGAAGPCVEAAGGDGKDSIVWCVRSDAGVIGGAVVLSVGAKIPCILWPVPVSVKPFALFPSLFYVSEMPWR